MYVVKNALLAGQVESQNAQQDQMSENFGRPGNFGGGFGGNMPQNMPEDIPDDFGGKNPFGDMFGSAANYITEVDSAMNLKVVAQMRDSGEPFSRGCGYVRRAVRADPHFRQTQKKTCTKIKKATVRSLTVAFLCA